MKFAATPMLQDSLFVQGSGVYKAEFTTFSRCTDDSPTITIYNPTTSRHQRTIRPELKKLYQQHPECVLEYVESVIPKLPLKVNPPSRDNPDSNHKTYPFLTVYEKTKIIGLRANQLSQGSRPFITVPEHVTDVREIARLELEQKRLPFIVKRPLPNGKYEYWRLADLMIL
jgi:DNA-directed RNA polymerase I, II, and III subunit RPABC2